MGQLGALDRVLTVLQGRAQAAGEAEWVASADSAIARAHQHAAGAPHALRGAAPNHTIPWPEPDDHGLGHSRVRNHRAGLALATIVLFWLSPPDTP